MFMIWIIKNVNTEYASVLHFCKKLENQEIVPLVIQYEIHINLSVWETYPMLHVCWLDLKV